MNKLLHKELELTQMIRKYKQIFQEIQCAKMNIPASP